MKKNYRSSSSGEESSPNIWHCHLCGFDSYSSNINPLEGCEAFLNAFFIARASCSPRPAMSRMISWLLFSLFVGNVIFTAVPSIYVSINLVPSLVTYIHLPPEAMQKFPPNSLHISLTMYNPYPEFTHSSFDRFPLRGSNACEIPALIAYNKADSSSVAYALWMEFFCKLFLMPIPSSTIAISAV